MDACPTIFTGNQWGVKRLPGAIFQGPADDKYSFPLNAYQPILSYRQFEDVKQAWENVNDTDYVSPVQGAVHEAQGGQRFCGEVLDADNRTVIEIDLPYAAAAAMHKAPDNSVMVPGCHYATTILSDAPLGPQDMRKYKNKTAPPYFARCTRQLTGNHVSPWEVHTDNLLQALPTANDVYTLVYDANHLRRIQSDPKTWENPCYITPNNPAMASTNDAHMFHRAAKEHVALLRTGLQSGKMQNNMAVLTRQFLARLDQDKGTKKMKFLVIDVPLMTGAWSQRLSAAFELQKRGNTPHRPALPIMITQGQIYDATDCLPQELLHPGAELSHLIHYQHLHTQPYMAKAYRSLASYAMVSGKDLWQNAACEDTAFLLTYSEAASNQPPHQAQSIYVGEPWLKAHPKDVQMMILQLTPFSVLSLDTVRKLVDGHLVLDQDDGPSQTVRHTKLLTYVQIAPSDAESKAPILMAEYAAQHNAHATDSTMLMNKDKVALIGFNPRALGREAGPQGLMKILSSHNIKITGHIRIFDGLLAITMPEVNIDALCQCLDAINLQWVRDNPSAVIEADRPSTWTPFHTITHDNHTHFTAAHPRPFPAEQGITTTQREQSYPSPVDANWVTLQGLPFASYNVGDLYNLLRDGGFTQAELDGGQWFKSVEGLRSLSFPRTEAATQAQRITIGQYTVTITPGLPLNAKAYTPPTATTDKTVCNRFQSVLAGKKPILTTAAKSATQRGTQHVVPSPPKKSTIRARDSPVKTGKEPQAGSKRSSSSRRVEYPVEERKEDGYTEVKQSSRTQVTPEAIAISSGTFGILGSDNEDEDQDEATMENPKSTTEGTTPTTSTAESSQKAYNQHQQQKQQQEKQKKKQQKDKKKREQRRKTQQEKEVAQQQKAQKEQDLAADKAAEAISATGAGELGTEGRGMGQAPVVATTDATSEGKEDGQGSLASPGGTSETVTDRRVGVEPTDKEVPGDGQDGLAGDKEDTGEAEVNEGMTAEEEKMTGAAGASSGGPAALPSTPTSGGSPAPPEKAQPQMEDDAGGTDTARQRKRVPDDVEGVNIYDARRGRTKLNGWENTDNDTAMRSATTSGTGLLSPTSAN